MGTVTDLIWSPRLERNIGYVWVPIGLAAPGTPLEIEAPGRRALARAHGGHPVPRSQEGHPARLSRAAPADGPCLDRRAGRFMSPMRTGVVVSTSSACARRACHRVPRLANAVSSSSACAISTIVGRIVIVPHSADMKRPWLLPTPRSAHGARRRHAQAFETTRASSVHARSAPHVVAAPVESPGADQR